jgi:hypothetical protein
MPEYSQATRTLGGMKVASRIGDPCQARCRALSFMVCRRVPSGRETRGRGYAARHPGTDKEKGIRQICTVALMERYNPWRQTNIMKGPENGRKTIVEKAAEKLGYGLAMAEDVAGSVKTAVGEAVATVTEALTPAKKASEPLAKKAPVKRAPEKAPAKRAAKKTEAKKSPTKKITSKKAAKKSVKTSAKKAGRTKR